jgi:hypothetical protein
MEGGEPVKINIMAVHAGLFPQMEPNYFRPRLHSTSATRTDPSGMAIFNVDDIFEDQRLRLASRKHEGRRLPCPQPHCPVFQLPRIL